MRRRSRAMLMMSEVNSLSPRQATLGRHELSSAADKASRAFGDYGLKRASHGRTVSATSSGCLGKQRVRCIVNDDRCDPVAPLSAELAQNSVGLNGSYAPNTSSTGTLPHAR